MVGFFYASLSNLMYLFIFAYAYAGFPSEAVARRINRVCSAPSTGMESSFKTSLRGWELACILND